MADLDVAAARFRSEHGLVALPGGHHPGRGTANLIIPLGSEYLELIAVVDPGEAAAIRSSQRVAEAVAAGRTFAVWIARTDDLAATRTRLAGQGFELPTLAAGARRRPDGVELAWTLQELVAGARPSPLPFLIEWRLAAGQHPGEAAVEHPSRARGIAAIHLTDPDPEAARERLQALLGADLEYTVEAGPPGVAAVVLDTPAGRRELR